LEDGNGSRITATHAGCYHWPLSAGWLVSTIPGYYRSERRAVADRRCIKEEENGMKKVWIVIITIVLAASVLSAKTTTDKQTTTGKTSTDTAAKTSKPAATASAAKAAALLDINSASKDDLEKLPGMGLLVYRSVGLSVSRSGPCVSVLKTNNQ
jgi:hypothetical protein